MMRVVAMATAVSVTSLVSVSVGGNLKSRAKSVSFRPPPVVFAIVWPVLYATTGMAWAKTKLDEEFAFLVSLLCIWLIVYGNVEKEVHPRLASLVVILSSVVFAWGLAMKARRHTFLVFPLATWLTFASSISIADAIRVDRL